MTTVKIQQQTGIILGITTFKDACDKCSKVHCTDGKYTKRAETKNRTQGIMLYQIKNNNNT